MSELPTHLERLTAALAGRYSLERELGEGGVATVYLAHDLKHNRRVALKVLKPELAAVLGAQRFLQEIQLTANLQHPHILPPFDSGSEDGALFYVMPLVQGESLRGRLDREKVLYLGLGDHGRALDNLERALATDSQMMAWLGRDAMFDPLRAEPRFRALMKKLNFVE